MNAGEGTLTLGNLVSKMGELEAVSVGEIAVLFALAEKLASLTSLAVEHSVALEKIHARTGMNVQELQRWVGIAEQAHVSGEAFTGVVVHLSDSLAKLKLHIGGQDLISLANVLHLNLSQFDPSKPIELIKAIQDSPIFKGMTPWKKNQLLESFGAQDILQVLNLTNKELKEYGTYSDVIAEKSMKDFTDIATSMTRLSLEARHLGTEIASWDAPVFRNLLILMTSTLKYMEKWFDENYKKSMQGAAAENTYNYLKNPSLKKADELGAEIFRELDEMIGGKGEIAGYRKNLTTSYTPQAVLGKSDSISPETFSRLGTYAIPNIDFSATVMMPDGSMHLAPTVSTTAAIGKQLKHAAQNLNGTANP